MKARTGYPHPCVTFTTDPSPQLPTLKPDHFTTAVSERIYPHLDILHARPEGSSSRGPVSTSRVPVGMVLKMGRAMSAAKANGDEDTDSIGEFMTAQTSSKLVQLLTTEHPSDSAQSSEGVAMSLYATPTFPAREKDVEDVQRPKSVPFGSLGSRVVTSRKSPLATSVSKAPPQLLHDHTQGLEKGVKIKTETTTLEPSAPPMEVVQPEIKKVNSHTGLLGKRKSAFPPTPSTSGKKPAVSEPPGKTERVAALSVVPPLIRKVGVADLARASMPTSRDSPADSVIISNDPPSSAILSRRRGSLPSPRQLPSAGFGIGESGDTPLREMMAATPSKGLSGSSSGGKESKSASPASRAVSWLEHLKSKLPLHQ